MEDKILNIKKIPKKKRTKATGKIIDSLGLTCDVALLAITLDEIGCGIHRSFSNRGRPDEKNTKMAKVIFERASR